MDHALLIQIPKHILIDQQQDTEAYLRTNIVKVMKHMKGPEKN
jgi:phage anti-repressor protein